MFVTMNLFFSAAGGHLLQPQGSSIAAVFLAAIASSCEGGPAQAALSAANIPSAIHAYFLASITLFAAFSFLNASIRLVFARANSCC